MNIRRIAPLLLAALAACTADRAPGEGAGNALRDENAPASAETAYLVWSADTSKSETVWIDGTGREIARRPGVLVAGSGGLWAWTEGKQTASGLDCECLRQSEFAEGAKCQTTEEVNTVVLADLLSDRRVGVLSATAEPDTEAAPPSQEAVPLSGAGPFLFLETRSDMYMCGAHGFLGVEPVVLDLSKGGERVQMMDSARAEEIVAAQGDAARRQLQADYAALRGDPGDDSDTLVTENLTLTQVEAAWTPAGTLNVGYQFTTGACYACGDGEAGSYSRSTILPAASVPAPLAPWTRAPDAVAAYWRRTPPGERAGWSQVDAADLSAALARFRARGR